MATTWDEILEFALTFPDTAESSHYGTPAAKVRDRMFGHGSVLLRMSEAAMDAEIMEIITEAWRIGEAKAKAKAAP